LYFNQIPDKKKNHNNNYITFQANKNSNIKIFNSKKTILPNQEIKEKKEKNLFIPKTNNEIRDQLVTCNFVRQKKNFEPKSLILVEDKSKLNPKTMQF